MAGSQGAPLAPEAQLSTTHFPGSREAMTPQEEANRRNPERQRQAKAEPEGKAHRRLRRTQGSPLEEIGATTQRKQGRRRAQQKASTGAKQGIPGITQSIAKAGLLQSETQSGSICADVAPGKPRLAGRAHTCQRCLTRLSRPWAPNALCGEKV